MKLVVRFFIISVLSLLHISFACASVPRVVVSIKPLYSWVSAVMQGVAIPQLLIKGGESVHGYTLKPSDAQALEQADVVFMVGNPVEVFLEKSLKTLAAKAEAVSLIQTPGIALLPARTGKFFESHGGAHHSTSYNPHIWLDPQNAFYATQYIAQILAQKDPEHAKQYQENAQRYCKKLEDLIKKTQTALQPYKGGKFVVFHDAYYYYEKRFGVTAVAALTVDPQHQPGARRLKDIREKISSLKAACVFSEPQFTPALLGTLVEGIPHVKTGALDPLGAQLPATPDSYFTLINNITDSLVGCLRSVDKG